MGAGRETGTELPKHDQPLDRRIAALADLQHGVVSLGQLESRGLTASAVRKRTTAGRLHRIRRGIYAVGREGLDRRGHWMAAVLACGPGALISHRTAAAALGLLPYEGARLHVTIPSRAPRKHPGITIHRSPTLWMDDRTEVDGVPCTAVARTLLDLADVVGPEAVSRAAENAERLRMFDQVAVDSVLDRATGRPARDRLLVALSRCDEPLPLRSELERRALVLFERAGLPRPLVNALVDTSEGPLEVDFSWPDRRLVVEVDGFEFHGSRAAFERDRRRDQLLRAARWSSVRITWRQVSQAPGHLVAALRADGRPRGSP